MTFSTRTFPELSAKELYAAYKLRSAVFVVEQNCVYQDIDEKDLVASHVFLHSDSDELVGYCRILPTGVSYDQPSIGRVVVDKKFRGQAQGVALMKYAIGKTLELFNEQNIVISAQDYLRRFYSDLGFEAQGEVYDEDGIPHIKMKFTASKAST